MSPMWSMSGLVMSTWGGLRLDGLALGRRRVAVIDGRGQGRGGEGRVQLLEGLELVLLQRLQGKEIQGMAPGFLSGETPTPADYKSGSCRWPWAWPPAGSSPPGWPPGPPPGGSRAGESPGAPKPPPPPATTPGPPRHTPPASQANNDNAREYPGTRRFLSGD